MTAVRFDGVWKQYRRGRRHDSLRDLVPALARRFTGRRQTTRPDVFWALRDVSFDVEPGRVLGIIGPNGAGKSTVLKLLSRIMVPTRGRIEAPERTGALIELAAGFHPDLTGRENVLLQGAILGMSRSEIRSRFDRIVAFAGVEEFIDTPVKRYSSGMNARLGFAIAAHLDPELLLIDEVLSVGDHAFQRRAFGRLREIVDTGIPVVVVSHQLDRIVAFADDAILLTNGAIAAHGRPEHCVRAYVEGGTGEDAGAASAPVTLESISSPETETVRAGDTVAFRVAGRISAPDADDAASIGLRVWALPDERIVFAVNTWAARLTLPRTGPFSLDVSLGLYLGEGLYRVQAVVWRKPEGTEWVRGPSAVVRVENGTPPAWGTVWLEPRLSFGTVGD